MEHLLPNIYQRFVFFKQETPDLTVYKHCCIDYFMGLWYGYRYTHKHHPNFYTIELTSFKLLGHYVITEKSS